MKRSTSTFISFTQVVSLLLIPVAYFFVADTSLRRILMLVFFLYPIIMGIICSMDKKDQRNGTFNEDSGGNEYTNKVLQEMEEKEIERKKRWQFEDMMGKDIIARSDDKADVIDYNYGSYFDGTLLQLIGWRILGLVVTVFSLGICYPWALCMVYRWKASHTVINNRRLKFTGTATGLFGNWLKWILLCIITFGIYSFWIVINLEKWKVKHTTYES